MPEVFNNRLKETTEESLETGKSVEEQQGGAETWSLLPLLIAPARPKI